MNVRYGKTLVIGLIVVLLLLGFAERAPAPPLDPKMIKARFEKLSQTAEVVAHVRVIAASCTAVSGEESSRLVTLQLTFKVVKFTKGPIRENELLLVRHQLRLRGIKDEIINDANSFPFMPGVNGDVALRWDAEQRQYLPIAGWVAKWNFTAPIPSEPGKVLVDSDTVKQK